MLHGSLRVMNIRPQESMLSQRRMVELRSYHAILKMLERLHVYQRYTPIIEFKIIWRTDYEEHDFTSLFFILFLFPNPLYNKTDVLGTQYY